MTRIFSSIFAMLLLCWLSALSYAAPIFNPATDHWYDTVTGDWFAAESSAVALGGHLVTINDAGEQNWLVTTFGGSEPFWIGFNDTDQEGAWVWVSGEPVTYTNWRPREPNNFWGIEDAAIMNWEWPGQWNDGYTGDIRRGIAEWGVISAPDPTSSSVPEPATMILLGTGMAGMIALSLKPFYCREVD